MVVSRKDGSGLSGIGRKIEENQALPLRVADHREVVEDRNRVRAVRGFGEIDSAFSASGELVQDHDSSDARLSRVAAENAGEVD